MATFDFGFLPLFFGMWSWFSWPFSWLLFFLFKRLSWSCPFISLCSSKGCAWEDNGCGAWGDIGCDTWGTMVVVLGETMVVTLGEKRPMTLEELLNYFLNQIFFFSDNNLLWNKKWDNGNKSIIYKIITYIYFELCWLTSP